MKQLANFETELGSFRPLLEKANVPSGARDAIFDLARGSFLGTEAIASAWEYYAMEPGSGPIWTYDEVVKNMQAATKAMNHSVIVVKEMHTLTLQPENLQHARDVIHKVDWHQMSAEFVKHLHVDGGKGDEGFKREMTKQFDASAALARSDKVAEVLAESVKRAAETADLNAKVFEAVEMAGDKSKGPIGYNQQQLYNRVRGAAYGISSYLGYVSSAVVAGCAAHAYVVGGAALVSWPVAGCFAAAAIYGAVASHGNRRMKDYLEGLYD
jgi:hypothetical protein